MATAQTPFTQETAALSRSEQRVYSIIMYGNGSRSVDKLECSLEDMKSAAEAECSCFAHEEISFSRTHPRVLVEYSVFEGPYLHCADHLHFLAGVHAKEVHFASALNQHADALETAQKDAVPVLSGSIMIGFSPEFVEKFGVDVSRPRLT